MSDAVGLKRQVERMLHSRLTLAYREDASHDPARELQGASRWLSVLESLRWKVEPMWYEERFEKILRCRTRGVTKAVRQLTAWTEWDCLDHEIGVTQ
jgi:hypothetical protein